VNGKLRRMFALSLQEYYIALHSLEIFSDVFAFPIINVVLFGLINHYLISAGQYTSANYLLIGVVLWEIIAVNQYSVSLAPLWNIWSRSLSSIFVAPISAVEYITADIISALLKSVFVFIVVGVFVDLLFHFNILSIGLTNLILDFFNLALFGWIVGVFVIALIFRYGTRIQAISWGVIFLFQPITASFYPVSALPHWLQYIALALPPTHVFQSARANLVQSGTNWHDFAAALLLNLVYGILAILTFAYLFKKSKETGQFARNDA
jgi:ABC-2 type transport system permease protein